MWCLEVAVASRILTRRVPAALVLDVEPADMLTQRK